ncbi:Cys-tRNA(Pro) deacylase [Marinomonas mediterranea]|uniref:Cys-tRNA(Pro)/Cys-tRNA(Cys) deacylase n=1 Tax=Marinomonas mediterranea (strain ATCC 700492 / JCM 21426 / NBRC 103028 / MMB-1) TaxID=717774 RepID=F2JUI3_MARM1|nr:Cys-tRNA(Pro) deacylase [Marinomonas mediterranea]ADZ89316.1 ybaK/ebsC protein [Marinomonas mediterranea MMB-1]WCN07419.1 Cys-tRNA(Pro) deacylase [Marinomonas mediterranea]WCN11513.1 Cys-tRNA(Pro) deacylase [Marinomonas mediterranea]WCN15583.1 Cys-tRNA(Pro) deacylase [Marinomonas mediterranea MMB-1]
MTPAINQLKKAKVDFSLHEYDHDPSCKNFGNEAADKLNLQPEEVFKTLLVSDDKLFFVCIVPVTGTLNLKRAASALKVKKLRMAEPKEAERLTGYLVGGISPLGQKKALGTLIDQSALEYDKIYVSGGKRGLDIGLSPQDLAAQCRQGQFSDIRES